MLLQKSNNTCIFLVGTMDLLGDNTSSWVDGYAHFHIATRTSIRDKLSALETGLMNVFATLQTDKVWVDTFTTDTTFTISIQR